MAILNVDIVSDPICPFVSTSGLTKRQGNAKLIRPYQCYLGKKRFERAVAVYQKTIPNGSSDVFNVTWKPFYLDPTLPQGRGIPVLERMAQKFGADRLDAINKHLVSMGQSEGICFSMQGKLGNTRDAHRLVQLARSKDMENKEVKSSKYQDALMTGMMRRYFEEGGDITSHVLLLDAAVEAGIDRSEAKAWLDEGKGGDIVDKEVQEAYARGIQGVPHFIINGRYEISGAQDVEGFLAEFIRAKEAA